MANSTNLATYISIVDQLDTDKLDSLAALAAQELWQADQANVILMPGDSTRYTIQMTAPSCHLIGDGIASRPDKAGKGRVSIWWSGTWVEGIQSFTVNNPPQWWDIKASSVHTKCVYACFLRATSAAYISYHVDQTLNSNPF